MIYSLLVLSGPASGHGNLTAARFARAVMARGHTIRRVFFLDEGAATGTGPAVFAQDEADPVREWAALAREHDVELVLCISSALRRGVLDTTEAERHERTAATAHPAFVVSGLGQLVDASAGSDRLVTFGG